MSHPLHNSLYKDPYDNAYLTSSNRTTEKEESLFEIAEKRYIREHGKDFQQEAIIMMIKKDIFESALKKLELAVALPSIISDPDLCTILTIDEMDAINDVVLYDIEYSKTLPKAEFINDESTIHEDLERPLDPNSTSKFNRVVYKGLKVLQKYSSVLSTRPHYKDISASSSSFLQLIREFLEQHALYRMYLTPQEARNKELHYRKLWHSWKKYKEDVARLNAEIQKQNIDHKKKLEDTVKRYKKNIVTIDEINKKCNEDIVDTTIRYEKRQLNLYKTWESEQRGLQFAVENAIDDFEFLKDIHVNLEEAIYKRRWKIELQLTAIINKYDTEIGGRHQETHEMNETYAQDTLEKQELKEELKQQEKILADCIEEKEVLERRITRLATLPGY